MFAFHRSLKNLLIILRWCLALMLCAWGIFVVTAFVPEVFDGGSKQPVGFVLVVVTFIGLLPLIAGLMLIFIQYLPPFMTADLPPFMTAAQRTPSQQATGRLWLTPAQVLAGGATAFLLSLTIAVAGCIGMTSNLLSLPLGLGHALSALFVYIALRRMRELRLDKRLLLGLLLSMTGLGLWTLGVLAMLRHFEKGTAF